MISNFHHQIGFGVGGEAFALGVFVVGSRPPEPPPRPVIKNLPRCFSPVADPYDFGLLLPEERPARARPENQRDGLTAGGPATAHSRRLRLNPAFCGFVASRLYHFRDLAPCCAAPRVGKERRYSTQSHATRDVRAQPHRGVGSRAWPWAAARGTWAHAHPKMPNAIWMRFPTSYHVHVHVAAW